MTTCTFTGQIYRTNPPNPDNATWTKIKDHRGSLSPKWLRLRDACPSDFRSVEVYGESDDGKLIVYTSHGRLFVFSGTKGVVSFLGGHRTEKRGINRIAFERGEFVLYRDGAAGSRFDPIKAKTEAIEGMNK